MKMLIIDNYLKCIVINIQLTCKLLGEKNSNLSFFSFFSRKWNFTISGQLQVFRGARNERASRRRL